MAKGWLRSIQKTFGSEARNCSCGYHQTELSRMVYSSTTSANETLRSSASKWSRSTYVLGTRSCTSQSGSWYVRYHSALPLCSASR